MSSAGGDCLHPVGEYFIKTTMYKNIFRDRIIVVQNLSRPFILGVAMQRANRKGMGYSTDGRLFLTIKGEVITQIC